MGRTRRNCPVFGCGSTNLARLANHLDQVHGMDTEERKKWLKWNTNWPTRKCLYCQQVISAVS